ncbi:hypothetical protein EC80566_4772 [Escherichia coli 8.0566]|nr:hypothetical protein EC80569_4734 [Escherichia coli 8.0569]EKK50640.1 hypothetical protein EC80566_4772 [Escherichia coli 8.0566]EKK69222.1 hypothetical protein EC80416_5656 [Escherichia coli 8.0416]
MFAPSLKKADDFHYFSLLSQDNCAHIFHADKNTYSWK